MVLKSNSKLQNLLIVWWFFIQKNIKQKKKKISSEIESKVNFTINFTLKFFLELKIVLVEKYVILSQMAEVTVQECSYKKR